MGNNSICWRRPAGASRRLRMPAEASRRWPILVGYLQTFVKAPLLIAISGATQVYFRLSWAMSTFLII